MMSKTKFHAMMVPLNLREHGTCNFVAGSFVA
jgi:hypothetical protein